MFFTAFIDYKWSWTKSKVKKQGVFRRFLSFFHEVSNFNNAKFKLFGWNACLQTNRLMQWSLGFKLNPGNDPFGDTEATGRIKFGACRAPKNRQKWILFYLWWPMNLDWFISVAPKDKLLVDLKSGFNYRYRINNINPYDKNSEGLSMN